MLSCGLSSQHASHKPTFLFALFIIISPMSIVLNSNASARSASFNLSRANRSLQASLERLSFGKKVNRSCDDAGFMDLASTNLEAAYGRIMDTNIAAASTCFARNNVLFQSSASMTAQAHQLSSLPLPLIE